MPLIFNDVFYLYIVKHQSITDLYGTQQSILQSNVCDEG